MMPDGWHQKKMLNRMATEVTLLPCAFERDKWTHHVNKDFSKF